MESTLFFGGSLWSPADWVAPRVADLLVVDGRIAEVGAQLTVPAGTR